MKKGTLDQKHQERVLRFEKLQASLPQKIEKLRKLQNELDELMRMSPNKYTHNEIHRKSQLMDIIDKLKNEIDAIQNGKESLHYIVNTLPILVDYYDNDNSTGDTEEEYIDEPNDAGKKNILSYFLKEARSVTDTGERGINRSNIRKRPKKRSPPNAGSKTDKPKLSRAKLYDHYLSIIDSNYRKSITRDTSCQIPGCDGEKIFSQNDGCLVCNKCGDSENILVSVDRPNYKEPTQDSGIYAYKRINHLTEILSQLQAKESTDIPPKVFESILREVKKRKINKDDLDIFLLRKILKKLNYRKYYEHVPHILQIINGKEPPNFSRKDEMRIKKMFRDIQKPFAIYCPKNRKNFLNYSYVLHKFCELLDLDQYINYFPLLKNNAKLLQHDRIWKNICQYMNWKYYKSI